jgi:hypothetical protein
VLTPLGGNEGRGQTEGDPVSGVAGGRDANVAALDSVPQAPRRSEPCGGQFRDILVNSHLPSALDLR